MHTIRKLVGLQGFLKGMRAFMMLLERGIVLQAYLLVLVSLVLDILFPSFVYMRYIEEDY